MLSENDVLWNTSQIKPAESLKAHENSVDALKIDPSTRTKFATGSFDATVKVWDVNSLDCLTNFTADKKGIWTLDYHPSGTELATGGNSGILALWDTKTWDCTDKIQAHDGYLFWLSYSPTGDEIATCSGDGLTHLWDRRNLKTPVVKFEGKGEAIRSVNFINNGKYLVTTSIKGYITIFEVKTGEKVCQKLIRGDREEEDHSIIYCIRPMKKTNNVFTTTHQDFKARTWEFDEEVLDFSQIKEFEGHTNTLRNIEYSPSEKEIVTSCEDHSLRIWDMTNAESQLLLAGHQDFVVAAEYIDESRLISSSWDLTVKIWNLN